MNNIMTAILIFFSLPAILLAEDATTKQLDLSDQTLVKLLLEQTVEHFSKNVNDYTGTFTKQERINDKVSKPQVINFKFKTKPHSIFMKWEHNPGKIDKLLYVENANNNKALLHPRGMFSWIKSVKRDPNDINIMKSTLKPCTEFGFAKIAASMLKEFKDYNVEFISAPCHSREPVPSGIEEGRNPALNNIAKGESDLTSNFSNLSTEHPTPENENIVKFKLSTEKPAKGSPAEISVKYDLNIHAPIERIAYNKQNLLMYSYTYKYLKFNTGLKDKDFTPKAAGM